MKLRFLLVFAASVFVGCADGTTAPGLDPSQQGAFGLFASDYPDSILAVSGLERAFLELEKEVPGFAGFFRENGALVALSSTDLSEKFAENLSSKLDLGRQSGLIERASVTEREPITRVERAQFRFRDLAIWRLRIRESIMSLPGVTTLDLDEGANRIAVGIDPSADRKRVVEHLSAMQVPLAAVTLKMDPAPETAQSSLASRIRPLTAGTRVGRYNNYFGPPDWNPRWTATNWCTLGTPAMYQGVQTLLVVSHCTNREGILENPAINFYTYFIGQDWDFVGINGKTGWNPPTTPGYNPFGYEQFDRAGPNCGPFWDVRPCRHAEVAVWNISGIEVIPPEVPFTLGRIARPQFSVPGVNPVGSTININPTQPYFTIGAEVINPVQGDIVQKVGLTTGWTHGVVYQTCVDINYTTPGNTPRRVWCYDRANLGAQGGDSGSPVFRIFDPGAGIVYFYGLVSVRGTDQPGSTGFGSVRQLRAELGFFQVF